MPRRITPPEQLCQRPHSMPCLAHRRVFSGELAPCPNCAPHVERVRTTLNLPPAAQPLSTAQP